MSRQQRLRQLRYHAAPLAILLVFWVPALAVALVLLGRALTE